MCTENSKEKIKLASDLNLSKCCEVTVTVYSSHKRLLRMNWDLIRLPPPCVNSSLSYLETEVKLSVLGLSSSVVFFLLIYLYFGTAIISANKDFI